MTLSAAASETSIYMLSRPLLISAILLTCCSLASAQKAEVTLSLNEAFFDSLLDSMYKNFDPPQFSLAQNNASPQVGKAGGPSDGKDHCNESVKILREGNGVRTAV